MCRTETRHWHLILSLFGLLFAAFVAQGSLASTSNKQSSLDYLKELRDQNQKRLQSIDQELTKSLKNAPAEKGAMTEKSMNSLANRIQYLREARQEHLLRQEFIHRLIFHIDSHYQRGPLKPFLERELVEMAEAEIKSPQGKAALWKFLSYLRSLLKNLPEEDSDLLALIEGYMGFSSIQNPKPPADFLSRRNYSNGTTGVSGRPIAKEEVGEHLDKRQEISSPDNEENRQTLPPEDNSSSTRESLMVITRKRSPSAPHPSQSLQEETLSLSHQADPNLKSEEPAFEKATSHPQPIPEAIVEKLSPQEIRSMTLQPQGFQSQNRDQKKTSE